MATVCACMCMYVCTVCICVLMHVLVYCVCVVGRYRIASNTCGIFDKIENILHPYAHPYVQVSSPVAKSRMPVPVNAYARTCTTRRATPVLRPYARTVLRSFCACVPLHQIHALVLSCNQQERDQRRSTYLICIPAKQFLT